MDAFKKAQHHHTGIGGIHCPCCNNLAKKGHGRTDRAFNGMARAKIKAETRQIVSEAL